MAERNTPVRLGFETERVLLEAGSGDEAQASESLPVHLSGEPLSIGFNPGYLLDGLAVARHPVVPPGLHPVDPAGSIAGAAEEGCDPDLSFRYLLMPLRLQG